MKSNHPVTQREYQFPGNETLLSTTDTASHMSYANAAFIRTSGYSVDELMGQPHNLVRHPDMPAEAFADMWKSLKDGLAWTALVKNRRQNGDHYWVRANAAPMRRDGQLTGYLSVRTKPSRAEVDATDKLYKCFKEGRAAGLSFHRGLIVRTGVMRWASALQLMPSAWRVRAPLLGVGAALGVGLSLSGLAGGALLAVGAVVAGSLLLADLVIEAQITAPLNIILEAAQQVTSGEAGMDLHFNRCDEIGLIARAINQAGLNLHSLVADVYEQSAGVQVASQEIAAATYDLSSRTEQTASNLEQTAAAKEIKGLIDDSVDKVANGTRLVADAGQTMNDVVRQVQHVNMLMAEITTASKEQSLGISKVSQAVAQLDEMTQQNAAMVEQSSAAASSMGEQ